MDRVGGVHAVGAALSASAGRVLRIWVEGGARGRVAELAERAREAGIEVRTAGRDEMNRLAGGTHHQGVVAEMRPFEYASFDDLLAKKSEGGRTALVLDGVTDPQNLGAVLRAAGAFGADFMVLPKDRSVGVTPVAARIASGAAEIVPVAQVVNVSRALADMKEAGFWCYSLEAHGDVDLWRVDLSGDVAFILGSEGKGSRPLVRKSADRVCRIPANGPVDSLNVASAAVCALYEVARQRGARSG